MIINNIVKDLETRRSRTQGRLERYNNRYHKTNILPLVQDWVYMGGYCQPRHNSGRAQSFRFCGAWRELKAKLYKAVDNLYNRDTLHRNKQPKQAYVVKELVGYDTMAPINNLVVRLVDSDNRPYSTIGLCNNSQWTYYALFHPCFVAAACFDYPSNKVFNFRQISQSDTAKF